MRNPIVFLIIGLFFGIGIGFLWAGTIGITFDGHDHGERAMAAGGHSAMEHSPVDHPVGNTAPRLSIILHKDAMAGVNLEIQTENFTFSPERVNQDNALNHGHAHVYVDGKKLSRVYGPWFYVAELSAGEHVIAVELNANSHGVISVGGTPVRVEQRITLP